MNYRVCMPPQDLAPWVECAWLLQGSLQPDGQLILPDGRLEVIFHFGDAPLCRGSVQPAMILTGRMTVGLELHPRGVMDTLGVRLRPGACGGLFPAAEVQEMEHLEGLWGAWARRAGEHLGNCRPPARFAALWGLLRERVAGRRTPDLAVMASVRSIEAHYGQGEMERFLPAGLSLRQWQRRFLAATGFRPKEFARIARFQRAVALGARGPRAWAGLALELGFYDQSHLINEFREVTGKSPAGFFAEGRAMEEFLHDAFFQDTAPRRGSH